MKLRVYLDASVVGGYFGDENLSDMKTMIEKKSDSIKNVNFARNQAIKNMLAVNGIYDGKNIRLTDKVSEKKKYRVVVTFIEELEQTDNEIRDFSAQTSGFEFWGDEREDIYQDYLPSKIKK